MARVLKNAADMEDYNATRARSSTEELNHSGLYKQLARFKNLYEV